MRSLSSMATLLALLALDVQAEGEPLSTATAAYRSVAREYRLDGIVEAVNRTTVSAQTQGQVQEIFYDVDDFVEKNAVLVRLKDTEHRARLDQAAADLTSAKAKLEQSREEHDRIAGLYRKKNVSDSAMDQAKADLASAQAALDAARARLDQAQEQLAYTEIRAPYSGIVTRRDVSLGEIASPGTPVMSGISLDQLRVTVDVPQSIIPEVRARPQGEVLARVYPPGGPAVEVRRATVFPIADAGSNTFKVRIDLPPQPDGKPRALFPGMLVKTGFVVGEKAELAVPAEAVVHRSEVTGVYVIGARDHVTFRQVRLGQALPDGYAILAGLNEGERVALDPIAAGGRLKSQPPVRHVGAEAQGHD